MPAIRSSRVRALLVLALLGNATVPGQETPSQRAKMTGWVADTTGKRVPNAEVHLLSWPMPPRTDIGTVDHLQVTTDAKGFFHAELLHGRGYSGHAFWRTGAVTHRTAIAEDLVPGPARALEECDAQKLERVRVQGAVAWQARGLQVLTITAGSNPQRLELKTTAEMIAELPQLPGGSVGVEVRTRDGQLLAYAVEQKQGTAHEIVVDLAPPTSVTVAVVDDAGKPLVGAVVYQANKYWYGGGNRRIGPDRLGVTDAAGKLLVQLPARHPMLTEPRTEHILTVEAEGRARMYATVDLAKTQELQVTLPVAPTLCGRLLDAKGRPAAGVTLLPEAFGLAQGSPTGGFGIQPLPLATAADGSFRFDSLHPKYGFRLMAVIDPVRARELGMQVRTDFALAPVLWLSVGEPPFAPRHDVGDLRLDQLAFARIEVRKCDRQPAPGSLLHVSGGGNYNSPLVYVTDRMGRMQFPLPKGEVKIGAYVKGDGVASAVARVPAGAGDPKLDPLLLELSAPVSVRGTVVDQDGRPFAGARVHAFNRPEGGDRDLAELAFRSHAPSAPTGSDGVFEVFLPYGGIKQELRAFAPGASTTGNALVLEVDAEQRQVTGVRVPIDTRK